MIVDTSALVAVSRKEEHFEQLFDAMFEARCVIPAPVVVEFHRVTALRGNKVDSNAVALIDQLIMENAIIEPFGGADAQLAADANERHGTGNGRGGRLNMLDLMVYGMARRTRQPILCTGTDFLSTDITIHPASRRW